LNVGKKKIKKSGFLTYCVINFNFQQTNDGLEYFNSCISRKK
jgi:hypothetical protein